MRIRLLVPRRRKPSSVSITAPPTAVPFTTATCSFSSSLSDRCASSSAICVAITAIWLKRAMRRASLIPRYAPGSKPFTSPAIWQGQSSSSGMSTRSIPDRPASRPSQVSSAERPTGVSAPSPVITTRRLPTWFLSRSFTLPPPNSITHNCAQRFVPTAQKERPPHRVASWVPRTLAH